MHLSVVILNWNAAEDTINCIRPLLHWHQLHPTIWVIDNASTDHSPQKITAALPTVHLLCNAQNLGFTGGTNRGIRAALAASSAPILLLNNDASISEENTRQLLNTMQARPDIGLLVPLLYEESDRQLIACGGKNPAFHLQTRLLSLANDDPLQIVDTVSGTAALTSAHLWQKVGLLDEDFFFSTEMADLSLRAARHGFLAAVDRRARAQHQTDRSARYRQSLYIYYIVRNRFLILRNHYRWHGHLWLFWLFYSVALALKLALENKAVPATAVWLAVGDALARRWGGQNERVLAACQRRGQS